MAFFGEDEGDGVEGVFGEELGAAEDDDDEAEGVEHLADKKDGVGGDGARGGEERDGDGVAEGGEAHEDSAGESGDGEGDAGAAELLAGVVGHLFVDVLGAGTLEVLLGIVQWRRRGLAGAQAEGHAGEMQKYTNRSYSLLPHGCNRRERRLRYDACST